MDLDVAVGFAGAKDGGREMGMVWSVREVFGFEAQARAARIDLPGFPRWMVPAETFRTQEVSGIHLDGGLIGEDFQGPPAFRMMESGGDLGFIGPIVQHPRVIVSRSVSEAGKVAIDPLADAMSGGEIERRVRDRAQFASGDEAGIRGKIAGSPEGKFVIEYGCHGIS